MASNYELWGQVLHVSSKKGKFSLPLLACGKTVSHERVLRLVLLRYIALEAEPTRH